jgi:hypothetical protein
VLHHVDELVSQVAVAVRSTRLERAISEVDVRTDRERVRTDRLGGVVRGPVAVQPNVPQWVVECLLERGTVPRRHGNPLPVRDDRCDAEPLPTQHRDNSLIARRTLHGQQRGMIRAASLPLGHRGIVALSRGLDLTLVLRRVGH